MVIDEIFLGVPVCNPKRAIKTQEAIEAIAIALFLKHALSAPPVDISFSHGVAQQGVELLQAITKFFVAGFTLFGTGTQLGD